MSIHSFPFLVIISALRANISRARQGRWWTRTDLESINHTAGKNKGSNDNRAVQGLFTVWFCAGFCADKAQEMPHSKAGF